MTSKDIVIAFDAYGTLLSTESIATKLAQHFGDEKAQSIAAKWRLYQLEYTWRLNSMSTSPHPPAYVSAHTDLHPDQYEPFSTLTLRALQHALTEAGQSLDQPNIDALMEAYDTLSTFPDVAPRPPIPRLHPQHPRRCLLQRHLLHDHQQRHQVARPGAARQGLRAPGRGRGGPEVQASAGGV